MPKVIPLFPDACAPTGEPVISASLTEAFDSFWQAYPRKVGKGAARRAWSKAVVNGADPRAILDACARLPAEYAGREVRFIPHASTWLNREGWEDAPGAASGSGCLPDPRTQARLERIHQIEEPPPPSLEERRLVGELLGQLRATLGRD